MHSNYERLFSELTQLLNDEDVQGNIDENLKDRVDKLIENNKSSAYQNKRKGSQFEQHHRKDILSKKVTEDMCHKFEKIVLKDSGRHILSGKSSIEGQKIKSSKRSESKYKERSR